MQIHCSIKVTCISACLMSQPFVYWGSMFLVIFYSFTWDFCTELIIKWSLSCFSDCAGICFVEQQFLFKSTSSLRWKKRNVNLTEYPLEVLAWAYCCGRRSGRKVRHVQPFGRFVLVVWIFVVRRLVVTAAALLSDLGTPMEQFVDPSAVFFSSSRHAVRS